MLQAKTVQDKRAIFFRFLLHNYPKPAYLRFFFMTPDKQHKTTLYIDPRTESTSVIDDLNQKGYDAWVGVNPRAQRKNRPFLHFNKLWADIDNTDTLPNWQSIDLPEPHAVVRSGGGYHTYWSIYPIKDENILKEYNRIIAVRLGADHAIDAARLMRVPETVNHKAGGKAVKLLRISKGSIEHSSIKGESNGLLDGLTAETVQMIRRADLFLPKYDNDMSRLDAAIAVKCLKAEKTPQEVVSILTTYPCAGPHERKSNYDYYARRTVATASQLLRAKSSGQSKVVPWKTYSLNELMDVEVPLNVVDGLIYEGSITLFAAIEKLGKSYIALQLAKALATGQPFFNMNVPKARRVLYIQAELEPHILKDRVEFIYEGLHDIPVYTVVAKATDLVQDAHLLKAQVEAFEPNVIIIDPVIRFLWKSFVDPQAVLEFIGLFDKYRAKGVSVLLIHHTRKNKESREKSTLSSEDISGSLVWTAAVDSIILAQPTPNNLVRLTFTLRAFPPKKSLLLRKDEKGVFWEVTPPTYYDENNPRDRERIKGAAIRSVRPVQTERKTNGSRTGNHRT